ncbi:DUF4209 domain-containing protein [Methanocorpusculum sp. GPch4]|uniref:DUF4209 domain-containing protein n=1 Tax=Methanocorpusculum sp. GPch4 TaxID=2527877 RepID=UPI0014328346|nr:DUF4209 domain-containing protein [Methanocorpusculum sp. GPch4]
MENINPLKEIEVTLEDYNKIAWKDILKHIDEDAKVGTLYYYNHLFEKLSEVKQTEGDLKSAKIFYLFRDITSYILNKPSNPQQPFVPWGQMGTFKTPLPDNFTDTDLKFFESILPEIEDIFLLSRIADTLWLRGKPRNKDHALHAIDAYVKYPLNSERFIIENSLNAWERALYLSKILKTSGNERYEKIINTLYDIFQSLKAESKASVFLLRLARLLRLDSKDVSNEKRLIIAEKLEQNAKYQSYLHIVEDIYDEAIKWYELAGKIDKKPQLYSDYVARIEERVLENDTSNEGYINSYLETAILTLRKIPKANRREFDVDKRLIALRSKKGESDKLLLADMITISSDPINIKELVIQSSRKITGKSLYDALVILSLIQPPIKEATLRKESIELMKTTPLQTLFPIIHVDKSGHTIASTPSVDSINLDPEQSEPIIFEQMLSQYKLLIGLLAQGCIYPALQTFNAEHHITESLLLDVVHHSSRVPEEREEIWAKALYYGFEYEFCITTHLFTTQLENWIRLILQENGQLTTTIDSEGIEIENALGTLIANNKEVLVTVFGEDLYFELRALLTERNGLNMRNEVAHGLLSYNELNSYNSMYLWWFCLRLVMREALSQKETTQK